MKLKIESFTTLSGWNINTPSIIALNEHEQYIAGIDNTSSLIAKFDTADTTKTLTKSLTPVDISDYDMLVFSVWSDRKGKQEYGRNVDSDFNYKIKINDTDEYYIPVYDSFTNIDINVSSVDIIDRIEITALHEETDIIILSEMIVEYEEMPIDLLEEVKNHIDFYLNRNIGKGILLGTISASTGDTTINTGDYDYMDRYSAILIDDGVNSEIHQLKEVNDNTSESTLLDTYDGRSILNDYASANIYLTFPTYINPDERDIRLPAIAIWGITPEPVHRTELLDTFIEAYNVNGNMIVRTEGLAWKYQILLDCEARSSYLISIMSKAIRDFLSNSKIWINGRHHEIETAGAPTETRPTQGVDIIPKIQYRVDIEVIERNNPVTELSKTDNINININIGGI